MNFPNLSFEGIKDYQKVANLLLENRNNAMNTLEKIDDLKSKIL